MPRRLLNLLMLFSFISPCFAAENLTVAQMERIILGTWVEKFELDGVSASGVSRYASDKTVEHTGSVIAKDFKVNYRFRSKWRIEGNTLITEVLETNQPEMAAVGDVERDTVVSMSQAQWTYRDSDGIEITAVRLRE